MIAKDRLFIGVGGTVVALDPATGQELWRRKIAGSSVATVCIIDDVLYGAANGVVSRLDPGTGTVLWTAKLPGLGLGVVAFPNSPDGALAAAVAAAQRQAAGA